MEENSSFFSRAPAPEVGNCCVIPESALRPLVGEASQFLRVLMALQAAALLPSAFAIPKGKSSVSLKDSFLFGISLSDHVKVESSSSALRIKANIIY
ncbi:hypothetical protein ACSBR2_001429 [Camellia fascicularis]